jgi:hypothetical protein
MTAPAKRAALLLVGDTIDDRRVVLSVLNETQGSIVAVVIPTARGRSPVRLKIGQEVVAFAVSSRASDLTPLRVATVAAADPTQAVTTLLLELGPRPSVLTVGLVQAFAEARSVRVERGRVHLDGPPLPLADDTEDAWQLAAEKLAEADPGGYGDLAFLALDDEDPGSLRVAAPSVVDDRLHDLMIAFTNREGTVIAEGPASDRIPIPTEWPARAEVRHRSIRGQLQFPDRRPSVAGWQRAETTAKPPSSVTLSPPAGTSTARVTPSFEAYGLLQLLEAKSGLQATIVAEVAERLQQAAPDDVRLVVRRGRALLEAGQPAAAAESLRAIPERARSGQAESLLLLAELELGSYEIPLDRYGRAEFDDWTFDRLVDAVASLAPEPAGAVTEALMMVLSEPRAAVLVGRVGATLPAGRSLIAIAGRVALISPANAVDLLRRAGDVDELPADLVERLYRLQVGNDDVDVAPAAIEHVRRLCVAGDIGTAATVADEVRHRLHWRDAQVLADVLLDHIVKGDPQWTDERLLSALSAAGLMQDAIRGLKDVDLAEALEVAARLRQALEPAPAEVMEPLAGLESELFTALESTEAHRSALEELAQASLDDLRAAYNGKRLFIVGGRRPDWFDEVTSDLALDRKSQWREVEPGKRPSMDWLQSKVGGERIDLLVVVTDYIAHATSAISEFAEGRHTRVAKARAGRFSFLTALRAAARGDA